MSGPAFIRCERPGCHHPAREVGGPNVIPCAKCGNRLCEWCCDEREAQRAVRVAALVCVCGPDHDCRATGCDEECEACNA